MIRPFGLRDIPGMRRLVARGTVFDLRRTLLYPSMPVLSSLIGAVTHHVLGARSWVWYGQACDERGVIQARTRHDRSEWSITMVAPGVAACHESSQIWHDLLTHAVASAAERCVMRVYACAPQDDEVEATMHGAGFTRVTREEIFCLAQYTAPAAPPKGLRRVDRADAWALDQFYRQVVPPQVQRAEGMRSRWSSGGRRRTQGIEFLWEDRGQIQSYMGLTSGPKAYWLEIIVRPERRADILPYVKHVMSVADCSPYRPIYCPVTDNSVGLGWILRTLNFDLYAGQVLFVAHTVAHVPVNRPLVVRGLERGIDSIHQQPT